MNGDMRLSSLFFTKTSKQIKILFIKYDGLHQQIAITLNITGYTASAILVPRNGPLVGQILTRI